jgi:hypothetical protein
MIKKDKRNKPKKLQQHSPQPSLSVTEYCKASITIIQCQEIIIPIEPLNTITFNIIADSLPNSRKACQRKKTTADLLGKLTGLM